LRRLVDEDHPQLSIARQCMLLGLPRSTWYYQPASETPANLALMRRIDEQYLQTPFYGSRRMAVELSVNRKRVQRLMRTMGLAAIYPKPRTTCTAPGHKIYPYLLRNVSITRPDQVWSTDITYLPMQHGFLYLVAVMDWFSRCVLAWRLSNTLGGSFCLEALDEALSKAKPEIFNSDQGAQFTATSFTTRLLERGIAISMDGRGRALDNVFIERLWRTVKYEEVYTKDYRNGWQAEQSLRDYFQFYCTRRKHQSLDYRTPAEVYRPAPRRRETRAKKNDAISADSF
jgi:putative transposase